MNDINEIYSDLVDKTGKFISMSVFFCTVVETFVNFNFNIDKNEHPLTDDGEFVYCDCGYTDTKEEFLIELKKFKEYIETVDAKLTELYEKEINKTEKSS